MVDKTNDLREMDPQKNPGIDQLISLAEAARFCHLSPEHLRRLVRDGDLWGKKIGRNWITTLQALQTYLVQDRKPGPKPKKSSDE